MELWRHCARWLIDCRVLPPNHRVTLDTAQVCDLAQALRDGVLLCQLLNNLMPHSVNLSEINVRPQMSQFLCLKNIRTFLSTSTEKFGMRRADLFEAFDLFDVRDFGKVINTLSMLSWTQIAQSKGHLPFPTEEYEADEDIYSGLSDQIDDTGEDDEDLYDCVDMDEEEGNEIYEDLMKCDEQPVAPRDGKMTIDDMKRCCLQELYQTEEKYSDTLGSICQYFMKPLQNFLRRDKISDIFINTEDLRKLHQNFLLDIKNCTSIKTCQNLYQVFRQYKEKFLIYGTYCSHVESATKRLEQISQEHEGFRMKLEECSQRANNGRFSLRDLLMVPMQRVLKYHLLLQELVKHTSEPTEKENLRQALDAMRDLAQYINEVKRDNETIKQITNFQCSIEYLNESLAQYGKPKTDGELKISTAEKKSKLDRYAFLFDQALLICKRKGDTYELKELIKLHNYQIRDDSCGDRDNKKWSHMFFLIDARGSYGYELFFKTRELKKKWMEQFEMSLSNMYPENAHANGHDFQMYSFEDTATCRACEMLLRGMFFQGYRCVNCRAPAHKECLGRLSFCGRPDPVDPTLKKRGRGTPVNRAEAGLTKMEACHDYVRIPPPPIAFGPPLQMQKGDVIELTKAEAEQNWWEGRNTSTNEIGFFPCSLVKPYIYNPVVDLSSFIWYAGPMERKEAELLLANRSDGTFLVRQRIKDSGEFAISLKFNQEVKHMKVTVLEGLWRLTDKKGFKGLPELVGFYQQNSLKVCFKLLDTTLQFPFKEPEKKQNARMEQRMKYLGSARARYDFCARDRTELSLREGDVIRILNKKGHQGWWKGEVYGKIGWFPSNYVEDDFSEYC
ncbi:proto-oncogene vav isoform X2 [Hyla sarda]|uniref:proto-oncogene vav isoform X2 n=1 Tax=Hyla sarda TaxID=327740 RepID=UPI0024C2781F|nr:proto-oncogene vav isoform X2 [Hyla sarda]